MTAFNCFMRGLFLVIIGIAATAVCPVLMLFVWITLSREVY
jgi:hypothetical protein